MKLPKPYYEDDQATIYCGDCKQILPLMGRGLADAALTDPPYNVGFRYDKHNDRMENQAYLDWLHNCFVWLSDVLKENCSLIWFWQGIRVANGEARACLPIGFEIHHLAAWFKREFAGDLWKGGHPAFSWEPIVWAKRGAVDYHGPRGGHEGRDCLIGNSSRHDVEASGHPCPKTESIVRSVLKWAVPEGGTVIDPFCGSGTVLKAAKDLEMKAIGIELSEQYCQIAVNRLRQSVFDFEGAKT